jgi:hypothetical protein
MRLIVFSNKTRLADYADFVEALNSAGAEAICVHDLKYCYVGESSPFRYIPTPKLLKLVKQFNPQFVLTDSPNYITYLSKMVGRRVFFHMRGAEEGKITARNLDIAFGPSITGRMYTHYLTKMLISSMKRTDLILPNSIWLQTQINQLLPNMETSVLYVGIKAEKWQLMKDVVNNPSFNLKEPMVVGVFQFVILAKVLGFLKFIKVYCRNIFASLN